MPQLGQCSAALVVDDAGNSASPVRRSQKRPCRLFHVFATVPAVPVPGETISEKRFFCEVK